jgi:hypothetical protein
MLEPVPLETLLSDLRGLVGAARARAAAKSLAEEFRHGFSKSTLSRATRFFETCPDGKIVATLWRQLSQSHFRSENLS